MHDEIRLDSEREHALAFDFSRDNDDEEEPSSDLISLGTAFASCGTVSAPSIDSWSSEASMCSGISFSCFAGGFCPSR